jgi:hypothetical protein
MNRLVLALAPAVLLATAGSARADVLSLRVEGHLGGAGGAGLGGGQEASDAAFFDGATGATWGFLVGLEALFVDAWVEHHQYADQDDFLGTWTQFMVGLDLDVERTKGPPKGEDGKPTGEKKRTGYFEFGLGVGFGVGTGQQVDPPLDASEVTDRGFLVEGKLGAGIYVANGLLGVGVSLPVQAGYFFKSGFANDADNQYYGAQGALLLVVRGKIKLK